jgi:nitrite reductase/ring-hydroxylating ferredoxin subunit
MTSLAAMSAMTAAGFLGGHLVYRRGVGVNTTAFESGPTDWVDLDGGSLPLGDRPIAARACVVPFVIVPQPDGSARVLEGRCTHRGGPLHEGELANGCIACPWHGSHFDLVTGAVRRGPATAPQPVYEVARTGAGLRIKRNEKGDLRRNPVR